MLIQIGERVRRRLRETPSPPRLRTGFRPCVACDRAGGRPDIAIVRYSTTGAHYRIAISRQKPDNF